MLNVISISNVQMVLFPVREQYFTHSSIKNQARWKKAAEALHIISSTKVYKYEWMQQDPKLRTSSPRALPDPNYFTCFLVGLVFIFVCLFVCFGFGFVWFLCFFLWFCVCVLFFVVLFDWFLIRAFICKMICTKIIARWEHEDLLVLLQHLRWKGLSTSQLDLVDSYASCGFLRLAEHTVTAVE